eukprot:6745471-Prymnesium_polylepis.1
MRCIAERLLPEGHERTYLQREIINEKPECPPAKKRYRIYCSRENPGALELLEEFTSNQGLALKHAPSGHAPSRRPSRRRSRARLERREALDCTQHHAVRHAGQREDERV